MNSTFLNKVINSDNIEYGEPTTEGEISLLDAINEGFAIFQKTETEDLHIMNSLKKGFDYVDTFFLTKSFLINGEEVEPRILRIRNYKNKDKMTGDDEGYTCQIHDISDYLETKVSLTSRAYFFYSIKASMMVDSNYHLGSLEIDIPDLDNDKVITEDTYNKIIDIPGMVLGHLPFFGQIMK